VASGISPLIHADLKAFFYLLLFLIFISGIIILILTKRMRYTYRRYKTLSESYKMTLKGIRDGRFELRLRNFRFVDAYLDENCFRILGYPKQDHKIDIAYFNKILLKESKEILFRALKDAVLEKSHLDVIAAFKNAQNQEMYIRVRGGVFEEKNTTRILGTWTNVDQEEKLKKQLQKDTQAFAIIHKSINLVRWNYNFKEDSFLLTREATEEVLIQGSDILNFFAESERTRVLDLFNSSLENQENLDFIARTIMDSEGHPNHAWMRIRGFPQLGTAGQYMGLAEVVTPLIESQQTLELQIKMLRALIDNVPFGIFVKELQGKDFVYKLWNPLIADLNDNLDLEKSLNKTDFEIFPQEIAEKFYKEDLEVVESGKIIDFGESRAQKEKEILIHHYKVPIFDKEDQIKYIMGIVEDISEKKALENQLIQAQKLDAIGKLAGGVAHDFNNMLAGIMGFTDLLLAKENNTQKKDYLEKVHILTDRAADLTDQLLTFSRSPETELKPVELHHAIEESLAILKRTIHKTIEIETHLRAENPLIEGEKGLLMNLFLNLGINARDAMPRGGLLTISTEDIALDSSQRNLLNLKKEQEAWIKITVSDTGTGIPQEIQEKIFEPFFTTKDIGRGTGLGLSAVYGSTLKHNGTIQLKSEIDKGSEFSLYFPRLSR